MAALIRLFWIFAIMLLLTLILLPIQFILLILFKPLSRKLPIFWHKIFLYLVGTRVHVHGAASKDKPLMFVANHISWSDIMILGSVCELCFIAKDDVRKWPGINYLAKLQRTVFVNRSRKSDAKNQANMIAERLLDGDPMVLFAEGTTGDGNKLLPYKSALFGAPQTAISDGSVDEIVIQSVAIAYNTLHGMPLGRFHQAQASWPGDLPLVPHLLNYLKQGAYDVDVAFGETRIFNSETKRKEIANEIYNDTYETFTKLRRLYHQ